MSLPVKRLPIPGQEENPGPVAMGAVWNGLAIITQIPVLADGSLETRSVEHQTELLMQHYISALAGIGSTLDDLMHVTLYVTDISDMPVINKVWRRYFPQRGPGRCTVEVSRLGRVGMLIEMTAFAVSRNG